MRIATAMRKKNQSSARISLFCTLAAITATSSYGLQTSVLITNYEITIFCLLTASFFLFKNYPKFAAIVIGYLASAKLYPAFMASLLLTHRDGKALVTFFLSVISFFAIGLLVFGQQENLYYFEKVFPVLLSEKVAPNLNNMSFGGGLFKFSKNLEFAQAAFQVYRFLFLSLTCFLLAKHHKNHTQNSIAVFAFLMVMMLMCLPSFWPSYLILLFPAFCVAIYRVVVCPSIVRTAILLTCIASMAFDMNTWTFLGAPGWLTGSAPPDELGNRIIETARHQSLGMAVLVFACHYPWTVFLYFLEQITFIVPSILWLFTAREIMSPALPHTAPCPNQPISSNPERYRRA